ncbi:hypothetical protein ACFSSA_00125 [Luteolibacter algae]|uniref:DUF3153 domain-containing protein n=1 Tax=Luteolibacter algae TaxID=454151 RepID=A0ABW5D1Z3_9BACT
MPKKRILKFLVVWLLATLLVSCFDTREEIWISADSSGAARIQVIFPAKAATLYGGETGVREMIEAFFDGNSAFSSHTISSSQENGRMQLDITCTFENALDLKNALGEANLEKLPKGGTGFAGETDVTFSGTDLHFKRLVNLPKAMPGAIFLPESQLRGHSLTTIIHLPNRATSHNATLTANEGRTLIWETPLASAFKKPIESRFTMPLPIPWLYISIVAVLILILSLSLVFYLRGKFRRRITLR